MHLLNRTSDYLEKQSRLNNKGAELSAEKSTVKILILKKVEVLNDVLI